MRAKLDLPGGVRGEDFIETKVLLLVIKLRDLRGQVNRAPVVDARFVRESRERLDLDGASRQGFDVEAQEMLNLFEREAESVRVQRIVAAACLKRIVTPARSLIASLCLETIARPLLKLFDGDSS